MAFASVAIGFPIKWEMINEVFFSTDENGTSFSIDQDVFIYDDITVADVCSEFERILDCSVEVSYDKHGNPSYIVICSKDDSVITNPSSVLDLSEGDSDQVFGTNLIMFDEAITYAKLAVLESKLTNLFGDSVEWEPKIVPIIDVSDSEECDSEECDSEECDSEECDSEECDSEECDCEDDDCCDDCSCEDSNDCDGNCDDCECREECEEAIEDDEDEDEEYEEN